MEHHRIVIIGHSCSGKSTLARRLSHILDIPHYDLDSYHWTSNWKKRLLPEFRNDIDQITNATNWVVAGNYVNAISDLVWPKATTLIYVELPLYRLLWNYLQRTASRMYHKRPAAGDNYETITRQLSRNSLGLHIIQTYQHKKQLYRYYMQHPPYQDLRTVYLAILK